MADKDKDNVEKSDSLKRAGNGAMSRHEYRSAINSYTEAIALNPTNHLLFSNRAQAYLSFAQLTEQHQPPETPDFFYKKASEDGVRAIELCPTFAKAYYRAAMAMLKLGQGSDALKVTKDGLQKIDQNAPERSDIINLMLEARVAVVRSSWSVEGCKDKIKQLGEYTGVTADDKLDDRASLEPDDSPLELFAWLVATAERSDSPIPDSELANAALRVARLNTRTAHVFGRTPGVFSALVGLAKRSVALPVIASLVQALALCTAESSENKQLLGQADIEGAIEHLFQLPDSTELLRTLLDPNSQTPDTQHDLACCVEALGDLLTGNEDMQRSFRSQGFGLMAVLLAYAEKAQQKLQAVSMTALGALCELKDNADDLARMGGVKILGHAISTSKDVALKAEVFTALNSAAKASPDAAKAITEVPAVIDAVMTVDPQTEKTAVIPTKTDGDASKSVSANYEQAAVELLSTLAKCPASAVPTDVFLSRFPKMVESAKQESTSVACRRNIAIVLGIVAEARMDAATSLESYVCDLLEWARQGGDEELRVSSLWVLSNIARVEAVVVDLVANRGVVELLCRLISDELRRPDIADNNKLVVAAFGLLRNLAVARANRDPLAEGGALKLVIDTLPLAGCKNMHITFDGIVLLNGIVRGNPRRIHMLGDVPNALSVITQIAKGIAFPVPGGDPEKRSVVVVVGPNGEKDLRVQYEAGRLLAVLCEDDEWAKQLSTMDVLPCLQLLVDSPFDVLRKEGQAAIDILHNLDSSSSAASASASEPSQPAMN